jgi:hypothetical protein
MSDKMKKIVAKASFFATGLGFMIAGLYAPEALPEAFTFVFGVVGFALAGVGGWFLKPEKPEE